MKKYILIILFILLPSVAFGANQWRKDTGEDVILGTEDINDIDKISFENIVDPIDRLVANYNQGSTIVYNSASTIDITAGSVVCSNSGGTIRNMRQTTSTINATFAGNLDTGAEANSTTYYLWADCDTDATTFTVKISASSSAPSGVTQYASLGNFFNNSSGDIDRTKVYQVPFGYLKTDSTGRGLITDVRDFGTSDSSYTAKTGADLKVAFGTITVAGSSSQAITNLPFTSASTYSVVISKTANSAAEPPAAKKSSGSSFTAYNNHSDSSGDNGTFGWIATGY